MNRPRQLFARQTYMVTRRTTQRMFLLLDSPMVRQAFLYCLAIAARCFGVEIHAFVVMSNHYHIILSETEPEILLPRFMWRLNLYIARVLNRFYEREENFWCPGSYSAVRLITEQDVVDKIVYTITNPVAARLVERPEEWIGLVTLPGDLGTRRYAAERPEMGFSRRSPLPECTAFFLTIPPALRHLSLEEYQERIRDAVEAKLEEIHAEVRADDGSFMGVERLRQQRPTDRPASRPQRGGLNPTIACRDKWRRIEVLQALREFYVAYKEAWEAWKRNDPIPFPEGTYLMRVRYHQPVQPLRTA